MRSSRGSEPRVGLKPLELAVVLPTLNEKGNVAPMVARLEQALGPSGWEAVFVDDNSRDGTAELIREIARTDPRVRVIQRIGRRGLASAAIEGMCATAAPYVAVMAMNRLAKPWEALRLPLNITRKAQETLLAKTDMGLVGEILFTRMENLLAAIMGARHPQFDADLLLENVSSFATLSSAIVKEIEMRRDGEWGQRILKDRAAVGKVMDAMMDRAPKEVAAAMPMSKGTGPKTADFARPVDAEKQALALKYARLVTGSRNFAAAASFAAKQKDAAEEMSGHLRRYNEDLVKELRGTDPQRRANAEAQFELCAELTAMLFSPEEAELLRRRSKAAQAA